MKKPLLVLAALIALGLAGAGEALADRGGHGGHGGGWGGSRVGIGVNFGVPLWSPWYYPPPYYPAYYPAAPVVIERQAPPIYVEQPQPVQAQSQAGYWYYCQSPSGYYPEVRDCNVNWIKVPPRP